MVVCFYVGVGVRCGDVCMYVKIRRHQRTRAYTHKQARGATPELQRVADTASYDLSVADRHSHSTQTTSPSLCVADHISASYCGALSKACGCGAYKVYVSKGIGGVVISKKREAVRVRSYVLSIHYHYLWPM